MELAGRAGKEYALPAPRYCGSDQLLDLMGGDGRGEMLLVDRHLPPEPGIADPGDPSQQQLSTNLAGWEEREGLTQHQFRLRPFDAHAAASTHSERSVSRP